MATIQGVYVALFGRPADPTGLAYFNTVTKNGTDLSAINNLAGQKEYTDRFAGQNNVQIVNSIYQSLFGRDAETGGLNFFVDALNKGTLNINNIAIAILDGAQGNDATIRDAKIASANLFTAALDTPLEVGSYTGNAAAASARAWLAGVTTTAATQASADAAVKAVVDGGAAGNTITAGAAIGTLNLTTGIGSPAVTTTNLNDTINAGTFWVPATTKIDGGLGVDTFTASLGVAAQNVAVDGLKNIEIVRFTSTNNAATSNVAEAKQATQVWNDANVAAGVAAPFDLAVSGLALTTTAGFKGAFTTTAQSAAFAGATGTADTASVAFDTVTNTTGSITVAAIETVNLSNTGASSVSGVNLTDAKTINIAGSGSLNLGLTSTAAETISASSFTGNLTINATLQAAIKSVVGGAGNDSITVDVNSSNALTVNGGAGNDTIVLLNGLGGATKAITLTGGDGADIFEIGTAGTAAGNVIATDATTLANSLVTISDFNKASDAIRFSDGAGTTARDTLLDAELSNIAGQTTLLAAAQAAAGFTTINQSSVFAWGGNAYLFTNGGADAAFNTGDTLVQVTGASVADFTATNFQII